MGPHPAHRCPNSILEAKRQRSDHQTELRTPQSMRLLLIRHGESSANAEGRLQGHLDFSLSQRGRRESDQLAERLSGLSIAALYASPLTRARETAELIAGRVGLAIEERSALMERNVGELAGLTREEIRARYPGYVRARTEVRPDVGIAGFESDADLTQRVMAGLAAIIEGHPEQTVAVVTHGGVIATFLRQTLSLPIARPGPFAIDNASIATFDVRDGDFDRRARLPVQLLALNDTCHLDGLAP